MRPSPLPLSVRRALLSLSPHSATNRAFYASFVVGGSIYANPDSPTLRGIGQGLAVFALALLALFQPLLQGRGLRSLARDPGRPAHQPCAGTFVSCMALVGLSATLTLEIDEHDLAWAGFLALLFAWNLIEDFKPANPATNRIAASTSHLDDGIAIVGWTLVVATLTCAIVSTQSGTALSTSTLRTIWWLRGSVLAAGLLLTWRESSRQHESTGWALIGFSLLFRISLVAPTALNLSDAFAVLCLYRMLRHIRPQPVPTHAPKTPGRLPRHGALCEAPRSPRLTGGEGWKSLGPDRRSDAEQLRSNSIGSLVLLALAFGIGGWLRLDGVGPAFLFGDELHSLLGLSQGYGHLMSHFSPTGSGMALPLVQRALIDGFGNNHWSIRAAAWVPGLILIPLTWWSVRRWFGEGIALGSTWLVAASPLLIFYSRFARSYALVALLVLLFLDRVQNAASRPTLSIGSFSILVGLAAAIPFVHPTALGSVVPIALAGACAAAWASDDPGPQLRRSWFSLLAVLPVAGLLCIALHWPARESLLAFVSAKTTQVYSGAFGPLDVARLVTGSDLLTFVITTLALIGALAVTGRSGWRAAPLLAATTGPLFVIALTQPYGDAYAYARYIIAAVAPFFILAVAGIHWLLSLIFSRPEGLAGIAAIALASWGLANGPPPPSFSLTPQHANTYLGLRELDEFNRPWPGMPAFYRELPDLEGRRPNLLEIPALTTRTRHLYRLYQRAHQSPTLLGPLPNEFPMIPNGPYQALFGAQTLDPATIDFVIVHRNVAQEVARYWEWIYGERDPDQESKADEAFMERHAQYGGLLPQPSPAFIRKMEISWGPPVYQDDDILVYRLSERNAPGE